MLAPALPGTAEREEEMELAIVVVGLLILGSQIPGNAHIMLR
jgi:hypothetical protein